MAVSCTKLSEFKGFAVEYDYKVKPYFKSQILEDLRKLYTVDIGKQLLESIGKAKPRVRNAKAQALYAKVSFPKGVNVTIIPTDSDSKTAMTFIQPGLHVMGSYVLESNDPSHNNKWCHFRGGSQAAAGDLVAAANGTGCISIMQYTNAQVITSKGEPAPSFIVLAHELVHSLHHVTGTAKSDGATEEQCTTGIGNYTQEKFSENAFRAAFGIKLRQAY